MNKFRALLLVSLVASALPSTAQYPRAWSTTKELGQATTETPIGLAAAPGGGYFMGGTNAGSTIVSRVGPTGSVIWTRLVPGQFSSMVGGLGGVATVSFLGFNTAYPFQEHFGDVATVRRFDPDGNVLWSQSFTNLSAPNCGSVTFDPMGNVLFRVLYGSSSEALYKLDAVTGNPLWSIPLANFLPGADIATDSAGNIYAAEQVTATDSARLTKYSPAGVLLWYKDFPQSGRPMVRVGPSDQPFFISGNIHMTAAQVSKLDPAGNVLWSAPVLKPIPGSCAVSSSGAVVIGADNTYTMGVTWIDPTGTTQWTRTAGIYGGPVSFDANGNVCAAYIDFNKVVVAKYDSAGTELWSDNRPLGNANPYDYKLGLALDSEGRPTVLYPTPIGTNLQDLGLSSFSPTGGSLWDIGFNARKSFDQTQDSVTDSAGNTYASAIAGGGSNPCAIAKFTPNGSVAWSRILPQFTGTGRVLTPRLAPGGGVVVGQWYANSSSDYATALGVYRYDASGNLLWSYSSVAGLEELKDVQIAPSGNVYLSIGKRTNQFNTPPYNLRVKKLSSSGNLLWSVDRPGQITRYQPYGKIAIDSAESVYVSFPTTQLPQTYELATLTKFDSAGNILWSVTPEASVNYSYVSGNDVALDSLGNPYFLVQQLGTKDTLYKLSPDGTVSWAAPLDVLKSPDYLAIDPLDNIFVGGFAYSANGQRAEVQKLDTSGSRLWSRYAFAEGPGPLRMIPDGAGGAYLGAQVYSPSPRVAMGLTRFLSDGSQTWPTSGGAFVATRAIYRKSGVEQYEFAGMGVDAGGNVYASGSVYSPSGSYDLEVSKYAALNSLFVAQSTPATMVAGQTYSVSSTFENTGINSWTSGDYKLNATNGATWGIKGVQLAAGEVIAPGQTRKFSFSVYAPTTPGVYPLQTKMYKAGASFGAATPTTNVVVTLAPDAARYVSQSEPTSVAAGAGLTFKITMRNVGTNAWTQAAGYELAPAAGYPTWNVYSVPLAAGDSVSQGADTVFLFNGQAPSTPGTYLVRFQMRKAGVFFGDRTTAKSIVVTP